MGLDPATLHGDHVLLEPLRVEHARQLLPAVDDPVLWQRVFLSPPDLEVFTDWVRARVAEHEAGTELPFMQRDPRTKRPFGCTALTDVDMQNRRMSIGHTWIDKAHRRTPANTEAKMMLLQHAFETLRAGRVAFLVDAQNEQAQQALKRIGAQPEGCLRNYRSQPDDTSTDCLVYSIIDREWREVKARLNRYLVLR